MVYNSNKLLLAALLLAALASSAVGTAPAEAPYRLVASWDAAVPGSGGFEYPRGIAVDGAGTVHLALSVETGIARFAPDGSYIGILRAGGRMTDPSDLVVDRRGTIYVIDWQWAGAGEPVIHQVARIAPDGASVTVLHTEGGENEIADLALDAADRLHVYIDRAGPGGSDEIRVFSPDGAWQGTLAVPDCVGPALAVGPDGRYLVSDFYQIRVLDSRGTQVGSWGEPGTADGEFSGIYDLAVDPRGAVFVVEYPMARVQKYSPGGDFLTAWPIESDPGDDGGEAKFVATDTGGAVYVASANLAKVQRFAPSAPAQPTGTVPDGGTYAEARDHYAAGGEAWGRAWGASDIALVRQHLVGAKSAYTDCLTTASAVSDPANAANLALLKSISAAYVDLADAALAMYDGADVYTAGRSSMGAGDYGAAAAAFQTAAGRFEPSGALFSRATTTLQSVVYAGTEFGDGTAYTAAIVPILDAKGAYMGEFSTYAQGWQHTALAYQASAAGDQNAFQSEATQAVNLFDRLRASPSFGADAAANSGVLAAMLGGPAPAG